MGPSHSHLLIDEQHSINISCLDGSPHAGRNPVLSKSFTDGCIELFWSISSDLLCLGVCVCVCVLIISRAEGEAGMQEEAEPP